MFEDDPAANRVRSGLIVPVLVLAATGIGLILLAGSLGAATSGRSFLSSWFGTSGHAGDNLTRTSALAEIVVRSGT